RLALREQHLDAAQAHRPAPGGSGGGDQSRAYRPVCGSFPGDSVHLRMLRPHGVGSDSPPAQARPPAAARVSGPGRSEGAVPRAEGVCSVITLGYSPSRGHTNTPAGLHPTPGPKGIDMSSDFLSLWPPGNTRNLHPYGMMTGNNL